MNNKIILVGDGDDKSESIRGTHAFFPLASQFPLEDKSFFPYKYLKATVAPISLKHTKKQNNVYSHHIHIHIHNNPDSRDHLGVTTFLVSRERHSDRDAAKWDGGAAVVRAVAGGEWEELHQWSWRERKTVQDLQWQLEVHRWAQLGAEPELRSRFDPVCRSYEGGVSRYVLGE